MSVCIYAIVGRGIGRLPSTGIAGERLRRLRVGAVEAIVGNVNKIPRPSGSNLRRYDQVLTSLWRRTPALLPVRFGTVLHDQSELELILDVRQDTLRQQLKVVRNRAQMTVRILRGSGIGDQGPVEATHRFANSDPRPPIPGPRSRGRSYLRARAGDAQRAREVAEFVPLQQAVRRWVRAERVEKRGNLATIYHLVPRSAVDRYRRAIEDAAAQAGVRLLLSGPWPAYAFADGW